MQPWSKLWLLLWPLALLLAGWSLSQLPFAGIVHSIHSLSGYNWLSWLALNLLILLLASLRWQALARALGVELPLHQLVQVRQAGSAINFLTPGPQFGGEPLQVLWLHRVFKLPLQQAVLVLGLDRFCETTINMLTLLTLVLLLGFTSFATQNWLHVALLLLASLAAIVAAATLILMQPRWLTARFRSIATRFHLHPQLSRIEHHWQHGGEALRQAFRHGQRLLWRALLLSLLLWAALMSELVLLLHLLELSLSPNAFILMLVSMRLSMLLPLPGGIGPVEAALVWSFRLLHLPATAALGMIALTRLRDVVVLGFGLACLWRLQRLGKQASAA